MENVNNFGMKFKNFDPDAVQTEEVINAVFVLDVSPSMDENDAIGDLNKSYNEFVTEMQNSHISDRLMVSNVKFCENVEVVHGFKPIKDVANLNLQTKGSATALYNAVKQALSNAMNYREQLENSGVTCKTLLFIITDGVDNQSASDAPIVKKMITDIKKNEKNAFTFTSILFGIGDDADFTHAQTQMGIEHLATLGKTAKDIRKMINFISSSISSSASGQKVSTVNF
jgi:uncharacterized protein YegL